MDSFSDQASERTFERGQVIYKENSTPTAAFAIQSGRVKLYRTDDHGARQVLMLLGPGDILGFRTLLANESHTATAEAIERASVCMVPRQKLLEMFDISSDNALGMMSKLAAEMRASDEQIISLLQHPVRQRTARLLLTLIDSGSQTEKSSSQKLVRLQRTEMAQILGTTPESLSRTLHTFTAEGLINSTRTSIALVNRTAMEKIANNT